MRFNETVWGDNKFVEFKFIWLFWFCECEEEVSDNIGKFSVLHCSLFKSCSLSKSI